MTPSAPTYDEGERLAVLDAYGILDTPPEKAFDDVVKLVSQLLDALDEAMVRRTSAIIARQAGHMTSLIDDLLDVSRVTRGKVELEMAALDIKDVIADAIEQVRPLVERHGHQLNLQLAPAHAIVMGDRKRLVQVMTNLLSNAIKYTPNGGRIDLRLDAGADALSVAIRDNGIGMSAELIENAFDLFSQGTQGLDRSQGGFELARALRTRPGARQAHLIAVTGYAQEKDRLAALAAGFDDLLAKPVNLDKLDAVLARIVS